MRCSEQTVLSQPEIICLPGEIFIPMNVWPVYIVNSMAKQKGQLLENGPALIEITTSKYYKPLINTC